MSIDLRVSFKDDINWINSYIEAESMPLTTFEPTLLLLTCVQMNTLIITIFRVSGKVISQESIIVFLSS